MSEEDARLDAARTTELPAFKMGRALVDSAKGPARNFTTNGYEDLRFALGETQWPVAQSYRAWYGERWKSRTVRNYTFATIQQKIAVCLDQDPTVRAEPMDELSTFVQRQDVASVTRHELERLRWNDYANAAMFSGSVCGTGITHVYVTRDDFSGMYEMHLEEVDPARFYPDPSANRLSECRFVVYEPELDMSTIRRLFPETWQMVSMNVKSIGKLGEPTYGRTNDELIRGPATGDITITRDGVIQQRRADIAFIWIKDMQVAEDVKYVLDKPPTPGYKCQNCGSEFEKDQAIYNPGGEKPACPECETDATEPIMLPPSFRTDIEKTKVYPYGRLIALCSDGLLSDDLNPYEIDMVFPFAQYTHYPIPGRYWGYGEVSLVRKAQEALNKHIAQGIDYMRLAGNGPLEVPAEVPSYRNLGNIPGDIVPCPAPFMGMAHYLAPTGYNVQMHQILDESLKADFREITGISEVSMGLSPSAPTSGVEVQARQKAASTRVGQHLKNLNDGYRSDLANIVNQMGNQFYTEPRSFTRMRINGELESIVLEWSQLPRNVRIKVSSNLDKTEKDQLFGQNLMQAVTAGQVGFYPDLMLPLMGADPEISREIQQRETVRQEQMAQAAAQQMGAAGGGAPTSEPVAAAQPTGSEAAYAAEGV